MKNLMFVFILIFAARSVSAQPTIGNPSLARLPIQDQSRVIKQLETGRRVTEIQTALKQAKLDGWLFYDFRGSDILIPRILKSERMSGTRRWYYYIPANGEPTKIVHAIEPEKLDSLPGTKLIYREWQLIGDNLGKAFFANGKPKTPLKIAMEYSPNNDIPYISRVDAGTIEMVRSLGVDVVTSADLVQQFEAVWTPEQLAMHTE